MSSFDRECVCCFTGHRPDKLGVGEFSARSLLRCAIRTAFKEGKTVFITGMAEGVDVWAAEEVLLLKREAPQVSLICALPYSTFGNHRAAAERRRYNNILSAADCRVTIAQAYSRSCYQLRNIWMVDNSSLVIAFYNGSPGGTRNTLTYAADKGVSIMNILPT
ncbi:MAG: DUF1273 domain-containing protein [Clostridia bacterium]|nr:DUF1273 domain-containing protein [Clostridia bacterium]